MRDFSALGTTLDAVSSMKTNKISSLAYKDGHHSWINLDLEFEGKRVFVVWDTIQMGSYAVKARLEIDPKHLKSTDKYGDYEYRGELVLPKPENN